MTAKDWRCTNCGFTVTGPRRLVNQAIHAHLDSMVCLKTPKT